MDSPPSEPQRTSPQIRPLYWSVRRELWENRSIYVAPLIVSGIVLFSFMISTIGLAAKIRSLPALDAAKQRNAVVMPYSMAATAIILTGFVVAVFYCLDALHGERRDRSILFWKSLPVSDRTTVVSKVMIPVAVQQALSFAIALATQLLMLVLSTAVLMGNGVNPTALWTRLPLLRMTVVMFYGLAIHALWFAPIYSWLLLVSAWARRAAVLWAALPIAALLIMERMAGGSYFASMVRYRLEGAMIEGFAVHAGAAPITRLSQLDPLKFLSTAGLWLGLAFAAGCLIAAARLRRNREPI